MGPVPALIPRPWCALFALFFASACSRSEQAPPVVVLITLDTTRADALSLGGAPAGVTPHLDALAEEGVVFELARTVNPLTLPSHASILTGLYPPRHGVRVNGRDALPPQAVTLAERAREQGFQTAAFVAAVVLDQGFGLDQGFEHYDQPKAPLAQLSGHYEERSAEEVVSAALAWLDRRDPGRPLFLWLHFYEPHLPYEPAPRFLAQAGGDPYLGEVAQMDAALAGLFDRLRAAGLWDEALVVVVGDHGEGRQEHGEESHGYFLFDTTMRVPMVVRMPASAETSLEVGSRDGRVVSVVDLFPTVVAAMGWGHPGDVDGLDLASAAIREERAVYFETHLGRIVLGWSPFTGMANGTHKYLHSSRPELFHVAEDRGETRDLYSPGDATALELRAGIERVARSEALPLARRGSAGDALVRRLEKLGYSGAGMSTELELDPFQVEGRSAPHDRIERFAEYQRAEHLVSSGGDAEAEALLRAMVSENPDNQGAHMLLGLALLHQGKSGEAIVHFERNLALRGSWYGVHLHLGLAHDHLGSPDRALAEFLRATELEPGLRDVLARISRLLAERGDAEGAAEYRRRWERCVAYEGDPRALSFPE